MKYLASVQISLVVQLKYTNLVVQIRILKKSTHCDLLVCLQSYLICIGFPVHLFFPLAAYFEETKFSILQFLRCWVHPIEMLNVFLWYLEFSLICSQSQGIGHIRICSVSVSVSMWRVLGCDVYFHPETHNTCVSHFVILPALSLIFATITSNKRLLQTHKYAFAPACGSAVEQWVTS